jgi:hypothetical protein
MAEPRFDASKNQYVYGADPSSDALQAVDGPITHSDGVHALTKATAGAYTLTPPLAGEEGMRLTIVARNAAAHVVTYPEGLGGNGGAFVKFTFGGNGHNICLLADNLHWVAEGAPFGVVVSA